MSATAVSIHLRFAIFLELFAEFGRCDSRTIAKVETPRSIVGLSGIIRTDVRKEDGLSCSGLDL